MFLCNEENDSNEKYIRKERYYGEYERSYYVGTDIKETDIDAKLENVKPRSAKGCQYGKDFIYTHCIGHLLTLKMPGDIDERYKKWDLNTLPFRFDDIPLEVNKSVEEQFKIVSSLIRGEIKSFRS